jgi:hypothetical protein
MRQNPPFPGRRVLACDGSRPRRRGATRLNPRGRCSRKSRPAFFAIHSRGPAGQGDTRSAAAVVIGREQVKCPTARCCGNRARIVVSRGTASPTALEVEISRRRAGTSASSEVRDTRRSGGSVSPTWPMLPNRATRVCHWRATRGRDELCLTEGIISSTAWRRRTDKQPLNPDERGRNPRGSSAARLFDADGRLIGHHHVPAARLGGAAF